MVRNETEIRIALQAILAATLVGYGFYGGALLVVFLLLPWKPFLSVGAYLAEPVVDWRMNKATERRDKGVAQLEKELDAFLNCEGTDGATSPRSVESAPAETKAAAAAPFQRPMPFTAHCGAEARYDDLSMSAKDLEAALDVRPAILEHVRQMRMGVFGSMKMEVRKIMFHGETAEALVRFQSPHVKELRIDQRYRLRQNAGRWQVESRSPANGSSKGTHHEESVVAPDIAVI